MIISLFIREHHCIIKHTHIYIYYIYFLRSDSGAYIFWYDRLVRNFPLIIKIRRFGMIVNETTPHPRPNDIEHKNYRSTYSLQQWALSIWHKSLSVMNLLSHYTELTGLFQSSRYSFDVNIDPDAVKLS